ncbi:bifunctional riboflavin kinase/FAD synthetase [Crocosphaera sp. XPORK-15E]|uniref:bifunctional riboflavin kinase/FAD synthetase n=1 Tax=Crocosphaera sp. XPORK-15E TaxID=3110247 RepID=UPI002B20BD7E|nr:bifunctional riboflavin kinase/FAD synthetase [Crocosphaera sp. XPORK-15E]MEA5536721.1 bifunctional riboflavin kinase/FAD synthetase [Crocosphaera sp. XPORK-15E]
MWVTSSTTDVFTPTAIALGNFDGIHLGHRQVLQPIWQRPEAEISTVVTFTPHPQEFFSGKPRQLLTPLTEKVKLLQSLSIKQLVRLPFDRGLASLSPQDFVADILVKQLHAKYISVGQDFRFGQGRIGTADELKEIAANFGVCVHITPLQTCSLLVDDTLRISSSRIRQALGSGDVIQAKEMLGYPYSLQGMVVTGQQVGRVIGFPTANLQLPPNKLLPRRGVYCVTVQLETATEIKGVMNIGSRPTVNGQVPTVEVHLLDWSGDLYGQTLTVMLEKFLRPEQKFPSLNALKCQIQEDCMVARKIFG